MFYKKKPFQSLYYKLLLSLLRLGDLVSYLVSAHVRETQIYLVRYKKFKAFFSSPLVFNKRGKD